MSVQNLGCMGTDKELLDFSWIGGKMIVHEHDMMYTIIVIIEFLKVL